MLPTLPLLALFAVNLTPFAHAAPVPQSVGSTNAPAGPGMTTGAELSNTLDDLVIPQAEAKNDTAAAVPDARRAPSSGTKLVEEVGDFTIPSDVTASHVAEVAK